jgi:hypothetical protein
MNLSPNHFSIVFSKALPFTLYGAIAGYNPSIRKEPSDVSIRIIEVATTAATRALKAGTEL